MTSKVTNFIKQYFFMLALAATFIGFSAFKFAERSDPPEDGWYNVTITGSPASDPQNQQIGSKLLTDPPSSGLGCAQDNMGDRCAIELTFEESATEVPSTVDDAENSNQVTVGDDAADRP